MPGRPLCPREVPLKIPKNIYKYLQCLNALGTTMFPCGHEKSKKKYLKIFEMPKSPMDPLCPRAVLKKSPKRIGKYLRCLNAQGIPMTQCGSKKILKKYLRCLNALGTSYVPMLPQKNLKNIFKYLRCLNALGIPLCPLQPRKKSPKNI